MSQRISIEFEIPKRILRGLKSGNFIRRGGVIQNSNGHVEMWLRESGKLKETLQRTGQLSPSPQLMSQMETLGMSMNLSLGLQALTLGVNVIGFAMINSKLKKIDKKLNRIIQMIGSLADEMSWLDRKKDAESLAHLLGALEHAMWAERTGRVEKLAGVRQSFSNALANNRLLMNMMIENQRAHEQSAIYVQYYNNALLAGAGMIRCDTLLDGVSAGRDQSNLLIESLRVPLDELIEPTKDLAANRHLLLVSPAQRKKYKEHRQQIVEGYERLCGHQTELDFCATHDISWSEWEKLGTDEVESDLVFLLPENH